MRNFHGQVIVVLLFENRHRSAKGSLHIVNRSFHIAGIKFFENFVCYNSFLSLAIASFRAVSVLDNSISAMCYSPFCTGSALVRIALS